MAVQETQVRQAGRQRAASAAVEDEAGLRLQGAVPPPQPGQLVRERQKKAQLPQAAGGGEGASL